MLYHTCQRTRISGPPLPFILKAFNRVTISAFNFFSHTKFYGVMLFGRNIHFLVYRWHFVWKYALFPYAPQTCIFWLRMKQTSFHLHFLCFQTSNTSPFFCPLLPAVLILWGAHTSVFIKPAVTWDLFDIQTSVDVSWKDNELQNMC